MSKSLLFTCVFVLAFANFSNRRTSDSINYRRKHLEFLRESEIEVTKSNGTRKTGAAQSAESCKLCN